MAISIQVGVAQGYVDTQDNALGGRISTNQTNLQALTTKVNTADTKIAAAQSSIDNLRSKVDTIATQGAGISQSQLEAWFEEQKKDLLDAEALNAVTEEIEKVKVGTEASQGALATLQATLGNVQGITAGVQRALEKKYEDISTILNGADDSEGVLDRLANLADLANAAQSTANRAYTAAQSAAQGGLDPEYVQGQIQNAVQGLNIPTMDTIETTVSNEITHRGLCTVQEVTTQVRDAQGVIETQVRAWVSAQGFANTSDIPDVSGLATKKELTDAIAQGIDQTTLGDAIDDYFEHNPVIADGSIIDDAVRTGTSRAMNSLMQEVGDMKSQVEVMSNTADDIDFEGLAVPETPSEDSNNASFNELVAKLQEKPVRRADVLKKVIDEDAYYWYVMPVIDQRIYRDTKIELPNGDKYTVEYGWQKAVKERYWYHKQDADMRDHYIYLFRSDINSIEMKASAESTAAFGKIDFKPLGGDTRKRKSKLEIARNIPLLGDLQNPATNSKQTVPTKQNAHIADALPAHGLIGRSFQIAPEVDLVAAEGKNIGNINSNKAKTSGDEVKLNSGADLNTTLINGFRRRLPQILIPSKIDWHAVQNELDLRDGNYPSDFYYIGCYAECDDSSMYESRKFFEDENKYLHLLRKEDSGALFYMDGDEKLYVDAKDARTYYVDAEGTKPVGDAWEDGGKVPTRDVLPLLKRRSFADVSRDIKVHMLPIYLLGSTGIAIDVEDVDGDGKYNYVTIDSMISPMAPSSKADVTQDNKHLFTAQTVNVENDTNKLILGTSTHKQYFSKNTNDYVQGVFNYVCRDNVAMAESGLPCVYGQGYTWLPLDAKGEADDTTGLGVHCDYFQEQMWIANGVYSHYNGLIPSGYTKASLKQMTTMYKYKIVEKFIRGHWNESNGVTAHNVWENDKDDGSDNGATVNETPIFLNDYSGDGIADLNEPIFDISIDDESVISYNIKEAYIIGNDAGGGIGVSNWIYDTLSYLTQKGTANTNNIFLICVADDGDEYIFDEYIWEAGKVLKLNEQKRIKYAADLRKVEFVSTNIGKARAATKTPDNRNIAKDSSYSASINGFDQLNKELISTDNIRNYLYNEELGSTETIANPKYKPAVDEINSFKLTNAAFDGIGLPAYEAEGEWPGEDKPDMNLGFYNIMFFWDLLGAMYKASNPGSFMEKLTNFVEGICKMNEEIDVWTFMSQLMNDNKEIPGFEEFSTWVLAQINTFAGKEHALSIPIEGGESLVVPEEIFEYMTSIDRFPEEIRDKGTFDMEYWREYAEDIISSYIDSSSSGIYTRSLEDSGDEWPGFEVWVTSKSEPDIIKYYKLDNDGNWSYGIIESGIDEYARENGLVEVGAGAIKEEGENAYLIAFKNENGYWIFDKENKCVKRVERAVFEEYIEVNDIEISMNTDQFPGLFDCAVWYMMWQLNRGDFHTKCEAFQGVVRDVQSVLKESDNPEAQILSVFHPLNWNMGAEPWVFEYAWRPGQVGNGEPATITLYHYNEVPWQIDEMAENARNTCRRYNKVLLFLKSVETNVDPATITPPYAVTYNFDAYRWTPSAADYIYIGTKSYTKIVGGEDPLASLQQIPDLNETKEAENPGNDTASQIADQTNSRFEELRRKIEWLESADFEALILNKMPQLRGLLQSPDFAKDANGNVRVKETPVIQEIRAGINTMVGGIQTKLDQLATVGNSDDKGINVDSETGAWTVVNKEQATTLPETPAPEISQPTTAPTQTLTMPTPSNLGKVRGVRNLSGGNIGLIDSRFQ